MDATSLIFTAADGSVSAGPDARIVGLTAAKLSYLKVGDFAGVGLIPDTDAGQSAVAVTILPAAMAGTGEGDCPWDVQPKVP